MMRVILILVFGGLQTAWAQEPCGPDAPCAVAGGDYFLAFPDDWDGESPLPALIFYHGHRSSGLSVLNSGSMHDAFGDHGYLLIAPNGAKRPGTDIRAWPARPTTDGARDDVAFSLDVIEDVAARVPLDRDRLYVAGFSAGGSMAYMMACYEGQRFAGAVSIAGALRRPIPDGLCPGGPVSMLHFHGYADTQVPLEGRGHRRLAPGRRLRIAGDLLRRDRPVPQQPDQPSTWIRAVLVPQLGPSATATARNPASACTTAATACPAAGPTLARDWSGTGRPRQLTTAHA